MSVDSRATLRPAASGQFLDRQTLAGAMRQRRSIGMLLLALLVAGLFAGLGQWQLSRAVQAGTVVQAPVEHVLPLAQVDSPQHAQKDGALGQLVSTSGTYAAGDFLVVSDRVNRGSTGYWVVGHLITDQPAGAQLAVGLGWAADAATAERVAAGLNSGAVQVSGSVDGRYVDSDAPVGDDTSQGDNGSAVGPAASSMPQVVSVPQLINLWHTDVTGPVYNGYVTARVAPAGLVDIYSPAQKEQVELNLLNLFYAAEWALFALVAFYVWYRLVRDRWEADMDAADEAEGIVPASVD